MNSGLQANQIGMIEKALASHHCFKASTKGIPAQQNPPPRRQQNNNQQQNQNAPSRDRRKYH